MNLAELQARARAIADRYDQHHMAAGRAPWNTGDLALCMSVCPRAGGRTGAGAAQGAARR